MTSNIKTRTRAVLAEALLAMAAIAILATGVASGRAQSAGQDASGAPSAGAAASNSAEQAPATGIVVALPRGKKLVLTDGTFQVVREYQRQGDRVRYYSLERSAWEEIPGTLVDWQATQRAEAEQQATQEELLRKTKAAATAALARELDVDASLQVRPGAFLPDDKGFFVVDGNQIVAMDLTKTETHIDKGRALGKALSGIALISDKHNVEIPGKSAKLRVHSVEPEFYFRPADGREPQLVLMRVDVKGDKRGLMTTTTNVVGESSYKRDEVAMQVWDAARGVYRFTVEQALDKGEYAVLEMTPNGVADYVWDFGVDAAGKRADPSGAKPKTP